MTRSEVEILLKTVYKGEGAQKALSDMDKISAAGSKLTGVLDKANKAMGGDVLGGTGGSESFRRRNPGLFAPRAIGALMPNDSFLRQGAKSLMGLGPLFPEYKGPPPPVIPPSSGAGAGASGGGMANRILSTFLSKAISIPAGLLLYKAINAPLQALTKTIKGLNDAIENARKLYASALSSGLGLKFTTNRALLSQVLGVSEKEVFQFGQAIQFLSPRLKSATDILSKTAPDLASVSYGFKILELDLKSLFALVISDLSPAIRKTTYFLSELIHVFERFHKIISGAFKVTIDAIVNSLPAPLRALAGTLQTMISEIPDPGKAPDPLAFMKQIQASSWERMGLIIGGGGASNPAQETARNTKATAEGVKALVKKAGGNASFGDPFMGAQSYL